MDKIEKLKRALPDIPSLVTGLKKEGPASLCGPCPICGQGEDRFVYKTDSKRCWTRSCGCIPESKPWDTVDFHAWKEKTNITGLIKKYLPEKRQITYDYPDIGGNLIHQTVKNSGKKFFQRRPDGNGGWINRVKDITQILYNLKGVSEALEVILCEGEKDAGNLINKLGFAATTCAGGAKSWKSEYCESLRGKAIVLIPDNDIPGREHMAKVARSLDGIAKSIKIVELPDLPEKGDFTNWLDTFDDMDLAAEKLAIMVDNTEPYEPKETETTNLPEPKQEPKSDLISAVSAIVDLDPLTRERERNRISKEHNVRKSIIDDFIKELTRQDNIGGDKEIVQEVEPSKNSVDGSDLLQTIYDVLQKYLILPKGVAEPIAAWVILTYCYDAFRILPMLGIVSPVKRCGKTTLLEVLQGLTNKGLTASNISPAAVFRTIEKYSPTLLVDEADTFLKDNDELRGVLNSGHTRAGAFVVRVEGESHEPVKFSTWGPKAVAMIGTLPDTLQDRSVPVSLRRKAPGEKVSRIDIDFENKCHELRQACRRWADDHLNKLKTLKPDIPKTNNDRMSDNWMPLLAIADVAGGDWPELMRKSMFGMIDGQDDSIGPRLLKEIQDIFQSQPGERIFSEDLVEALRDKKESPWCDWNRGKGLTQNGLARLLKPFSVHSKTMRIAEDRKKGYELNGFKDAFQRYIPSLSPITPISCVTPGQTNNNNELDVNQGVTRKNDVTDKKQDNQLNIFDCHTVTDEKGGIGKGKEKTDLPVWKKLRFESEDAYLKMIS